MPLNLRVEGDAESCRDAAEKFGQLANGVYDQAGCLPKARSESESIWTGEAAEAFRSKLQPASRDTDKIVEQLRKAGRTMHHLADDLHTVHSRMDQARRVAAEGGLTIDGDTIHEPQPAPAATPPPQGQPPPPDPMASQQAQQAQADHQRQTAAYQEAKQTVDGARKTEREAHSRTQDRMSAFQEVLQTIQDNGTTWLGYAAKANGAVTTGIAQAGKWADVAERKRDISNRWTKLASKSDDPAKEAWFNKKAGETGKKATRAANVTKANDRIGANLRNSKTASALTSNAGQWAADGSTLAKVGGKIPFVGAGLTTLSFGLSGSKSGDWGKAAISNFGGFAAATLTTEGALAGAASLGLAGGPVTLAAVGAGFGVAMGVGAIVDHWDDITGWFE